VAAGLAHASAVEDDDQVGRRHGREAVRDDQGGGPAFPAGAGGSGEALEECVLGLGVERRGRFVEDERNLGRVRAEYVT
jgi:hypothetical protein